MRLHDPQRNETPLAVAWLHSLQATHSEIALGTFAVVQRSRQFFASRFTGVIIDRERPPSPRDMLDAARAVVIVAVAFLSLLLEKQSLGTIRDEHAVAAGFWMFWPTITALIQELTPD